MERDDVDTIQLKVRMRERTRSKIEASARENGVSLSAEIVERVEKSFDDEVLHGAGARMLLAMRKVVTKVLRLARDYDEVSEGSPQEDEIKARKELRSAIDYIARVYAGIGEPLPQDFVLDGLRPGEWGSGDVGRLHAQVFLADWADDPTPLDRARAREVDFYWTPGPPQRSLSDIITEAHDGRNRNAAAPPRPSDSGPDDEELPIEAPPGQPKRPRKAKPKT